MRPPTPKEIEQAQSSTSHHIGRNLRGATNAHEIQCAQQLAPLRAPFGGPWIGLFVWDGARWMVVDVYNTSDRPSNGLFPVNSAICSALEAMRVIVDNGEATDKNVKRAYRSKDVSQVLENFREMVEARGGRLTLEQYVGFWP